MFSFVRLHFLDSSLTLSPTPSLLRPRPCAIPPSPLASLRIHPPPRSRNYAAHAAELNNAIPSEPFFFLKPPSSIIADGEPVECPRGVTLHHEGRQGGLAVGSAKSRRVQADIDQALSRCAQLSLAWLLERLEGRSRPKTL